MIIELSKGFFTTVDTEDYERLNSESWHVSHALLAIRTDINIKTIYMHRVILNLTDPDLHINHINNNRLDNRKENLRVVNNSQNRVGKAKQSNNTSGYKGVSWDKNKARWTAQIQINKKHIRLGYYNTAEDAFEEYCNKGKELFGNFFNDGISS